MNKIWQFIKNNIWSFLLIVIGVGIIVWIGSNYKVDGSYSLTQSWLIIAIVIILFFILLGLIKKGHLLEILIDPRTKKISLSKLQMAVWTVVIVSAYFAIVLPRVHRPIIDLDNITEFFSVGLPAELLALMGISTVSLTGSLIIKNAKQVKQPTPEAEERYAQKVLGTNTFNMLKQNKDVAASTLKQTFLANELAGEQYRSALLGVPVTNPSMASLMPTVNQAASTALTNIQSAQSQLLIDKQNLLNANLAISNAVKNNRFGILSVNQTTSEASLIDLFTGEEMENDGKLELGKIQMFLFTLITVITYVAAISVDMVNNAETPESIKQFPVLSTGLIALLAVSHAGYLAEKAVDKTQTEPS